MPMNRLQRLAGIRLGLWPFLGSGDFQDVSAWLTTPWAAASLQSSFLHSVGFCLCDLCKAAKGFAPFCTGAQMMLFVVARNVLLWQRWPTAPRAALGRASPAAEGGDLSLGLGTGEMM